MYLAVPMDKAHVDGMLVTAPAWPAHPDWLAKFLHVRSIAGRTGMPSGRRIGCVSGAGPRNDQGA